MHVAKNNNEDEKMSLHQRNAEIIQERNNGKTYRDIASKFGLSPVRIEQIVNRYHEENDLEKISSNLVADIRKSDDIDKKWPADTLLHGLHYPWLAKKCLTKYFESSKLTEISLRDLMDFLICDYEVIPSDIREVSPVFIQVNAGWKTFWALLSFFSEQNFGPSFTAEWDKRLVKFISFAVSDRYMVIPNWLYQYRDSMSLEVKKR
jgi:DNA-binding CsgD family transcriptional regulator